MPMWDGKLETGRGGLELGEGIHCHFQNQERVKCLWIALLQLLRVLTAHSDRHMPWVTCTAAIEQCTLQTGRLTFMSL